jgi:hypothetical protein
MLLMFMS